MKKVLLKLWVLMLLVFLLFVVNLKNVEAEIINPGTLLIPF